MRMNRNGEGVPMMQAAIAEMGQAKVPESELASFRQSLEAGLADTR